MSIRKVYIVTSGCYSDYSIAAVFSSRKRAEKHCLVYNHGEIDSDSYGEYGVEEYTLNDWNTEEVSWMSYACRIEIKTGEIPKGYNYSEWKVGIKPAHVPEPKIEYYSDYRDSSGKVLWDHPAHITAYSRKSQEHAKKVAIDYRTKILAEQAEGLRDEEYHLIEEAL